MTLLMRWLQMLGTEKTRLVSTNAIRRFLIEKTQHRIGGFGKCPGDPPGISLHVHRRSNSDKAVDIYHSYLGLAALAIMKEPGIKQLDPILCISVEQKECIVRLRKSALVPTRTYWKHGYSFSIREDDPEFDIKMESNEGNPSLTV